MILILHDFHTMWFFFPYFEYINYKQGGLIWRISLKTLSWGDKKKRPPQKPLDKTKSFWIPTLEEFINKHEQIDIGADEQPCLRVLSNRD